MPPTSSVERIAIRAAVWASLFPYISPVALLRSDTQPWALLLASLALVISWRNLEFRLIHASTLLLATAAVFLFLLDTQGIGAVRTVAGYLTLLVVSLVATHALRVDRDATLRAIDWALIVWLAVGVVQRLVARDAFTWLISDARTTELRGVIGLAPEPTYYASTVLLMVLWRASVEIKAWHAVVALAVIFGLASSSQVAIIAAAAVMLLLVTSVFRPRYLVPSIIVASAGAALFAALAFYLPPSRLGLLVSAVVNNPSLLLADESINERAVHIFAGFYSVWAEKFLPNGIDGDVWLKFVNAVVESFPNVFWVHQYTDRIMSGLGAILFQMGFLALVFIYSIVDAIVRWPRTAQYKLIWSACFALIFMTAIPLAHPLVGALLGALACVGREPFGSTARKDMPRASS